MRNALIVALAATLLFTVGAVGQQESLLIDLRPEPARTERAISIYEAAAANDFRQFAALYREKPLPEYEELHRLWSWSMEDPIGAFYGTELYGRLASLYPGYAAYIANYQIIDSHGNSFYPSAETRRFLLGEAVLGVTPAFRAPLQIATAAAPAVQPSRARATPPPVVTPARSEARATTPAVVRLAPAQAPAPLPAAPLQLRPQVIPATPPPVLAHAEPERVRGVVRRNEADRGALSRSIFLMIAGLLGIGMLTLMLHTPADEDRNLTSHAP